MTFKPGDSKPKNSGRKKGTPNKKTVAVKVALSQAFSLIGDIEAFARWAKSNRTEFYKLWSKMLPQEITGKDGGPITHEMIVNFIEISTGNANPTAPSEAELDTALD